jgi:hypothetical protein
MTSPSDPVPPTDDAVPTRSDPPAAVPAGISFLAFVRAPFRALSRRAEARRGTARRDHARRGTARRGTARRDAADRPNRAPGVPTVLFRPGEIEFARLHSLPPFDADLFILTDRRLMRVRTDAAGHVAQLSQTALWQVEHARAEDFRDRSTVTVELHVGSSMRLEETASANAHRFVATLNEATERSRS